MQDKRECYGWRSRRETGADPQWCIDMVNMWTRVRHLKRVTCSRSSGQAPNQSQLVAVKLHHLFVDTDAYVASSDVSLVGYICTHVFLIYVFAERLQSHQQFHVDFDVQLVTSATILCLGRIWQIVRLSAFFIYRCLYSDMVSFRMCFDLYALNVGS